MKALVSSFLVPVAFCMACALGGWAVGRASTPVRILTIHGAAQVSSRGDAATAPSGKRSYDAATDVTVIPPHMNSCADPLKKAGSIRLTRI